MAFTFIHYDSNAQKEFVDIFISSHLFLEMFYSVLEIAYQNLVERNVL